MTVVSLQLLAWPYHAGLRREHGPRRDDVAADEQFRASLAAGGPSLEALLAAVEGVFTGLEVAAAALTAYDPRVDGDGGIAAAARTIAARIARGAAHQRLTRARR
jgi:hypothetical protein